MPHDIAKAQKSLMDTELKLGDTSAEPGVTPVLEMRHMSKRYGESLALDRVDFDVRPGEIHALMGENGAGKTTLIEILAGSVRADGGEILIGGEQVSISSVEDARRLGISVVHQELSFIPNLTVGDNLFLGRELRSGPVLDRRSMYERSAGLLGRLGLTLDPSAPGDSLDVAERQAVEICKALAQEARVIVLDEPTAALTEGERLRLLGVLNSLRAEGIALIYISHRLSEIEELADRVTVLRNGGRVLTRPMAEVSEDEIVYAMIGETIHELFPPRAPITHEAEPVIDMRSVDFGSRLRAVDLRVYPGEVVGVTGLLGSGYREVGRLAAGILHPTRGDIHTRGGLAIRLAPGDRKAEGLATGRSGRENLSVHTLDSFSRGWRGFKYIQPGREREFAEEQSRRLGLKGDVQAQVSSLSGGNQQKVLIGRTVAGSADLLVLEEPTRGVDVGARADLYQLIRAQAATGTGVLVVSMDLREVAGLCDRVIVLNRGSIAAEFTGAEVEEGRIYRAAHMLGVGRPQDADVTKKRTPILATLSSNQALVPMLAFAALFVITALGSAVFLTAQNLENLARQGIVTGLTGQAQLLVVLAGHIDLSIGANSGLANLVSTDLFMRYPPMLVVPVVLLLSTSIGAVNGLLVRLGMPALLATYAMMSIIRGVIFWLYPRSIGPVPEDIWVIDRHTIFGVPTSFVLLIGLFLLVSWVLRRTRFGLHLYAVGGDARSARLSAVRTHRVVFATFLLSGLLAGVTGIFLSARLGAGLPNSGVGLELESIAVVMIGGASLMGGRGTVAGLVAGVGIVVVLANMMNLWGLDAFLQDLVKGAIIVVVAVLTVLRDRRRARQSLLRGGQFA